MMRATRTPVRATVLLVLAFASGLLTSCGATPVPVGPAGIDQLTIPTPSPDPEDFPGGTTNPWFPLEPGTTWIYRRYTVTGHRRVTATVLDSRRRIAGIATTAVRWQVAAHGARVRTVLVRWYAVDRAGNVWWFGQRAASGGPRLDRLAPRSWLAGRHGARAGLVLTATPRVGDGYVNAAQPRVVARRSTVVSVDGTVATAWRTFHHTVVTRDLSSLAPLHSVETFYARGIGLVAEEDSTSTSTSLTLRRMTPGLPDVRPAD